MNRKEMEKIVKKVVKMAFDSENDIFFEWSPHCNMLSFRVFDGKWEDGGKPKEDNWILFDHHTKKEITEKLGRIK